ncbi:hypothetical protein BDV26DRAFT_273080 [Aspergillus bertholletiae]|uniref:Secreted protein n=1 Tax=Aspergillus bertholletiae TaxID=1226010 RepID=A0A5N7AV87_9EURO|nr:hypothetical protein BDV26DRAFT_273080 [Aspergillus bertholletiae]
MKRQCCFRLFYLIIWFGFVSKVNNSGWARRFGGSTPIKIGHWDLQFDQAYSLLAACRVTIRIKARWKMSSCLSLACCQWRENPRGGYHLAASCRSGHEGA